ncbi:MAG TPA: secretin N-terminal domain-containing protein [Pyrinomonadaceae bacterium]|nr:secretin N-terminal domain-containing protein [Pyrinomonadaceae bacterium]
MRRSDEKPTGVTRAVWAARAKGAAAARLAGPRVRACVSLLLLACLLAGPAAALAPKGEKNYRRGLEHEAAERWEKAAEEFALAAAADPSNAEYQLHYRRAVFNASQFFMKQGAGLFERGDFLGAHNAFRRAYGYDPVNDLARSMMEKSLRLQLEKDNPSAGVAARGRVEARRPEGFDLVKVSDPSAAPPDEAPPPPRAEQLRVITYSGDLEDFVKYLAREIKLNVMFDRDFPKRVIEVDLQEVTAAQALDYVFLTQGLFFQKLSNRTILVADQVKRPQYQQLVLRTFYLYNVDPNDARQLIQASIPPQAGRQPVITANKSTNSITVRDTPENIRLVGEILRNVDKERAEVVMDVKIYEVSRTDLMQLGNQFGSGDSLQNLGGIQKGLSILGGSREVVTQAVTAPTALGAALLIPATTLSALQRKDTTRLVASTQVHAFDGEKSTAHIGQRVPVQTATVTPYGAVSTGEGKDPAAAVTQGLFGGNGYPVIQYEKTGLTLEFTPQVFPNLDVQVKMSIKSNDVAGATGGAALTPTFTERNIEGTARIQNNRTMMIASVAQNQQTRGRQGLPVLGLVPVLGRLFTAPRRNDQQTDIIIAVTPQVLRAPSVNPRDEEMYPSGTLQTPTSESLEAMLETVRREEQLAYARRLPRQRVIELPDAEPAAGTDAFVPAPKALLDTAAPAAAPTPNELTRPAQPALPASVLSAEEISADRDADLRPTPAVLSRERRVSPVPASRQTAASATDAAPTYAGAGETRPAANPGAPARSAAALRLVAEAGSVRVGERRRLKLLLKTDAQLGLLAVSLRFDPERMAVRAVTRGDLVGPADATFAHRATPDGHLLVSVSPAASGAAITGVGVLFVVEVEALAGGATPYALTADDVHVVAADGRKVSLRVVSDELRVVQ